MSKLEELIQQYCPDGVEWKTLGEATIMKRGTSVTKGIMQEGNIPVISGGRQPAFYCNVSNRTGEVITVAGSGAGAGYVQYWNEPIFVCDAFSIQGNETLKTKYVYYILTNIQEKIYSTKKGGGVPHVHISSIEKFEIPVPPLPVQEEIVRILDNFTELQAELQAELQKRLQQYNYYRDNLLSFEGRTDVKYLPIKEVLKIKNGRDYKHLGEGSVPVYGSGGIMTYVDTAVYDKPSVLIPRKGSIDKLYYVDKPFWNVDTVFYTEINKSILVEKYLFYLLQKEHLERLNTAGGVPSLTQAVLNEVIISIPALEEQKRIVSILDRFEALTNDLTAGLPAEIAKRRQQYEYYRDKLLTFKRKAA